MHKLLTVVGVVASIVLVSAAGQQPELKAKHLAAGDLTPALRVTKWLQGHEIKEFAAGKIYVVDFWATWCDPCIAVMPQISRLQKEYREKGVSFIGFTALDEKDNTLEKVTLFVSKRGPKLGYSFAYSEDRATYDTWIASAKRTIPCSFVIGKDRKIAFVGHPMFLGEVLPKVVAGTWVKADVESMAKVEAEVMVIFNSLSGSNAEEGLNALLEFQKKHPLLSGIPYFISPRIRLLLLSKKEDEARKIADEAIAKAIESDDTIMLSKVSAILRSPEVSMNRAILALSLKSAEAWLKIAGDKDMFALWNLAESHFALGDKMKAREYGAKAIAATNNESGEVEKYIQQQIKRFDEEKKDK